ncbi:MAG TPA: efflux RND transporter periplasmic adaptor subunit [Coriobacteriia bacterium]|nr:efflux RND transporter periplasmic adaptor subunit [Coriobacteriia bacterium]
MSKKTRIIAAVVAIVVVGAVVAFFALKSQGSGPQIDTAKAAEKELSVTVTASGKVEAGVQADVYPATQGIIDDVLVSDGETVTAGTTLATLDTDPLELQVAQARAGLSSAKAQLSAVDQQKTTSADKTAAKANVDATHRAYLSAKAQYDSIGGKAPTSTQVAAAEAGTNAAKSAYNNAKSAYDLYVASSPNPSIDPTATALGAAKDAAYAAYLGAQSTEETLKSTDLSSARIQAKAGVSQAYAAWKGAEAAYKKAKSSSVSQQKAAARAGVRSAAEALALAQKNLDDASLVAPVDGVVIFNSSSAAALAGGGSSSKLGEGTAVTPGSAPFSVVDLDALKFTAEVDEADVDRVKVGMNVDITLDAFPGETFASRVVRVNPVAQTTATGGTVFEVEIVLDATGKDVLIGMKGDATIKVSSRKGAITVPVEALFSEGGTDYVYVVETNKLKKTEITVGATTDTEVEVLSGLEPGQVVALSGSTQYTDGMSVRTK